MRLLIWLSVALAVSGCAGMRSHRDSQESPPRARERLLAASRKLAEDIDAGLDIPQTNEWYGIVCREELIGGWRAKEVCDILAYSYDEAKNGFCPPRANASFETSHDFVLFSNGKCDERCLSEARHFRLDLKNGTWTYSNGVLTMRWDRPKIDICYRVRRLASGDLVLQKETLPFRPKPTLFFDEECRDRHGCKRQIRSATGWHWSVNVIRPIVAYCVDELDRKKFSDVIDRCQRERDLRSLLEAGVISQDEFTVESRKLKEGGK